jgi:predicted TIM-barrel fold metal-dependent hydrolase
MDEAGVDKAIALTTSPSVTHGEETPKVSIWECNEYVAEAQKRYPDRIIGFARIDPLRKDSLDLLETSIVKWGLKGVKIHPTLPVTHELVQPVMSKINEMQIPVSFHMGVDPLPFEVRNGNPVDLDSLTARFSKLKLVAAHHARGFEELLTAVILNRVGQIYSDISLWHYEHVYSPWQFLLKMRYLMDRIPRFVLMGSDWPWGKDSPMPYKDWFAVIKNLKIPDPILQLGWGMRDFTPKEKDMILGENARIFLGI